jgi:hypothetical protein
LKFEVLADMYNVQITMRFSFEIIHHRKSERERDGGGGGARMEGRKGILE